MMNIPQKTTLYTLAIRSIPQKKSQLGIPLHINYYTEVYNSLTGNGQSILVILFYNLSIIHPWPIFLTIGGGSLKPLSTSLITT